MMNSSIINSSKPAYIQHRIEKAQGSNFVKFHPKAIQQIYRSSKGIPRLINKICEAALLLGASRQLRLIEGRLVQEIVTPTQSAQSFFSRWFKMRGGPSP